MMEKIDKFDTSNYDAKNMFVIMMTISIFKDINDEFPCDIILSFYETGAKAHITLKWNT